MTSSNHIPWVEQADGTGIATCSRCGRQSAFVDAETGLWDFRYEIGVEHPVEAICPKCGNWVFDKAREQATGTGRARKRAT